MTVSGLSLLFPKDHKRTLMDNLLDRVLARAGVDIVVAEFDALTGQDAAKGMVYL